MRPPQAVMTTPIAFGRNSQGAEEKHPTDTDRAKNTVPSEKMTNGDEVQLSKSKKEDAPPKTLLGQGIKALKGFLARFKMVLDIFSDNNDELAPKDENSEAKKST